MVGTPGRSKACLTCRRRRKGCDYARPACSQCKRARIDCEGYEAARVFVNSSQDKPPMGVAYRASAGKPPTRGTMHGQPREADSRAITQPDSLARSAYEDLYFGMLWDIYLPKHHTSSAAGSTSLLGAGLPALAQKLCPSNEILRVTLLANALATVGRRDNMPNLMEQGVQFYGQAVNGLQKALRNPLSIGDLSLLTTVKLLNHFELFFGWNDTDMIAQSRNWRGHNVGELALLASRRPEAHIAGDGHEIFADGRSFLVFADIMRRKRSMLSLPEWKAIPWQQTPKTFKDILLDILVDMPGLLEDLDTMRSCTDPDRRQILGQRLLGECCFHDKSLLAWATAVSPAMTLENLWEDQLRCEGWSTQKVALAHILSLYWTTCLILYDTMAAATDSEAQLLNRVTKQQCIRSIASAVTVLRDPSSGMYGQHVSALPLGMALQYAMASDLTEEEEMLVENFEGPQGRIINGFLLSVNSDEPRRTESVTRLDGRDNIAARARAWVGK